MLLEKLPSRKKGKKSLPHKEYTESTQYIIPPRAILDMMERVAYCFPHTFAFILTMQEHKSIHTESEKTCMPHTGKGYWIVKSSYNRKVELALWQEGRKKVISKNFLPKNNMHVWNTVYLVCL